MALTSVLALLMALSVVTPAMADGKVLDGRVNQTEVRTGGDTGVGRLNRGSPDIDPFASPGDIHAPTDPGSQKKAGLSQPKPKPKRPVEAPSPRDTRSHALIQPVPHSQPKSDQQDIFDAQPVERPSTSNPLPKPIDRQATASPLPKPIDRQATANPPKPVDRQATAIPQPKPVDRQATSIPQPKPPPHQLPPAQISHMPSLNSEEAEGDRELSILWKQWHSNVAKAIFVRFQHYAHMQFRGSKPMTAVAAYSVTRDGKIVNARLTEKNENAGYNALVLNAITSLNGNNVLDFPRASRRTSVDKICTFRFNDGSGAETFKFGGASDKETIRHP